MIINNCDIKARKYLILTSGQIIKCLCCSKLFWQFSRKLYWLLFCQYKLPSLCIWTSVCAILCLKLSKLLSGPYNLQSLLLKAVERKLKCQNAVKLTIVSDLFSGAFNLIKAIRFRPESLQNSYFPIKPSVAIVLKYE